MARLLKSVQSVPERCHLVGAYGLGKCQRLIALLREAGSDAPIWLHGALIGLCDLYKRLGVPLGDLRPAVDADPAEFAGQIVMAPPGALRDRWSRKLPDPVTVFASGWMRVRQRARQRGVELPLVLSDHADWDELVQTIDEVEAGEIWVTHGREDALVHHITKTGRIGRALALIGARRRGRVMRSFAELLDRLAFTPSRNGKLRLMVDYFRATRDPDRGWGLAILTGGLDLKLQVRKALTELMAPRVDPELYRMSRDYVWRHRGDGGLAVASGANRFGRAGFVSCYRRVGRCQRGAIGPAAGGLARPSRCDRALGAA